MVTFISKTNVKILCNTLSTLRLSMLLFSELLFRVHPSLCMSELIIKYDLIKGDHNKHVKSALLIPDQACTDVAQLCDLVIDIV